MTEQGQSSSPLIIGGLLIAALCTFVALYYETLGKIAQICLTDDDYSHGLLLPFITAYIFWDKKDTLKKKLAQNSSRYVSWSGCLLLIIGVTALFFGLVTQSLFIRWVSFFFSLLGLSLLAFGHPFTLVVAPALLLNFMAKPLPDSLIPRLFGPFQVFAAKTSARVLELLGVPVYLVGNIIEVPGMKLLVEEACSGMRSLISLLTVALIVLCVIKLPRMTQLLIILLSIVIALALNVVRVAMTGVLAYFYDPTTATGFFHTFSGMITFLLGLVLLYLIGQLLSRRAIRVADSK